MAKKSYQEKLQDAIDAKRAAAAAAVQLADDSEHQANLEYSEGRALVRRAKVKADHATAIMAHETRALQAKARYVAGLSESDLLAMVVTTPADELARRQNEAAKTVASMDPDALTRCAQRGVGIVADAAQARLDKLASETKGNGAPDTTDTPDTTDLTAPVMVD